MRNVFRRGLSAAATGALSLVLLASCTSEPTAPELEGTASITVLDIRTGLALEGVGVEVLGTGSAKTGKTGTAVVKGLRVGSHQVRLSKKGYESSLQALDVDVGGNENVVALNVLATYTLHPVGPALKGRLLIHPQVSPDTSATLNAAGVTVELYVDPAGGRFVNARRTAVTDSAGVYFFRDLPEGATGFVSVPQFTRNGKRFRLVGEVADISSAVGKDTATHPFIILFPENAAASTPQVFPRSTILVANQGWVFEFSTPIDTSRFVSANALQLRANSANVASTRAWSNGFKVLTVRPSAGTWTAGVTYSLVLSGVRDSSNNVVPFTTINGSRPTATP